MGEDTEAETAEETLQETGNGISKHEKEKDIGKEMGEET